MFPLFAIFYDVKSLILHLPVASPMFFLSIIWRCNQQWTASDKIWSAFFSIVSRKSINCPIQRPDNLSNINSIYAKKPFATPRTQQLLQ